MNLKSFWAEVAGMGKGNSSKIRFLLGLAAIGVILILAGSLGGGGNKRTQEEIAPATQNQNTLGDGQTSQYGYSAIEKEEKYLSAKLEAMLSQIQGAGEVRAIVSLGSSTTSEYAINDVATTKTTQEHDQSGGTRTVAEESKNGQVVLVQSQGGQAPLVKQSNGPHIVGVLIVAEGAKEPRVKAKLFDAACVALGVEPQKIIVVTKRGE